MFRSAAIVFVLSMLLTTVASSITTGVVHAQRAPQHVFGGYVSLNRQPLNDGSVRVTVGPGIGLQPPVQEIAHADIRQGRYKIAVEDPTRGTYSRVMLRFSVTYQGREYQRPREVRLEPGKVTQMNFDIEGWLWHQVQPQRIEDQPRIDPGRNASQQARLEMERERMDREEEMRREQIEREEEMRREEGEERREMERERMEQEQEMRWEQMEMERERMDREEEMRREQMELDRQRMGSGRQPGVQPVAGGSPKSGPSRGLFSNRKAGEASSGIDNIMDPQTLAIIGIVLTVLTTGMTLFKGN